MKMHHWRQQQPEHSRHITAEQVLSQSISQSIIQASNLSIDLFREAKNTVIFIYFILLHLIGCSETRTVSAQPLLNTRIPMWLFMLKFSSGSVRAL